MSILLKSIPIVFVSFILAGCPEEFQGDTGASGTIDPVELSATIATLPGVNCWDLNADGIPGLEEDRNHDGFVDVKDCHADVAAVQQNPGALYNQEKMCKMLHALSNGAADSGAFDTALADLGCHSQPITTPTGTVQRLTREGIRDNNYPLFSIEPSTRVLSGFDWVIKQAYVARTIEGAFVEQHQLVIDCEAACVADTECVAAAVIDSVNVGTTVHCQIFHHSDSLQTHWNEFCGFEIESANLSATCMTAQGVNFWGRI